jgi:hypothetical protein
MQRAAARNGDESDVLRDFAKEHPEVAGLKTFEMFLTGTAKGKALVAQVGKGPFLGYASYASLNAVVIKLRKPAKASTVESRRKNAEGMRRRRARDDASAAAAAPGSRVTSTTDLTELELRSLLAMVASGDYVHRGDSSMTIDWVALADAMDKDATLGRAADYFVPKVLCQWYDNHVVRKAKK